MQNPAAAYINCSNVSCCRSSAAAMRTELVSASASYSLLHLQHSSMCACRQSRLAYVNKLYHRRSSTGSEYYISAMLLLEPLNQWVLGFRVYEAHIDIARYIIIMARRQTPAPLNSHTALQFCSDHGLLLLRWRRPGPLATCDICF